jgi:hypothetical protein
VPMRGTQCRSVENLPGDQSVCQKIFCVAP